MALFFMIIKTDLEEEFHSNGNLSYRATRGILHEFSAHLYPERRLHPDGYEWIYCGICGKWSSEGRQIWVLNYNLKGELMNDHVRDDKWAQM